MSRDGSPVHYLLTRHAQAAANAQGRHLDFENPLSELGRAQAEALARRIEGRSFDRLIHSGSRRTAETAAPLIRSAHIGEVVVDPRFTEGSVGTWVGSASDTRHAAARREGVPVWELRPPGGESYVDIDRRLAPVLADIESGAFGANVLIVGHGRANSLLLRSLLGIPWEDYEPRQMLHASVTEFEITEHGIDLESLEDVAHLAEGTVTR